MLLLALPLPSRFIPGATETEKTPEARIMFGGDMLFDRYIRQVMMTIGGDYVFSCIDQALLQADTVVANLEGPITDYPSTSMGTDEGESDNFVFTFPPQTAALLARHNIGVVNLGNNHILNFGDEGLETTKKYLEESNVAHFGGVQKNADKTIAEKEINGISFVFISFNEFLPGESVRGESTRAAIRAAKTIGKLPIVYAHWGDEYQETPERVKLLARSFVDEGAVFVVGSHPHIVQEIERYKDTYIYYSLGNFIFDQYFSEEVTQGLLLDVTFTKDGVAAIKEIPIQLYTDGRTCVVDPVER